MKLALVGPSYPFKGGIPQYTTHLYRHLDRQHEVLFVSFSRQYPNWLYPGGSDRDESNRELLEGASRPIIDSLNPFSWRRAVREITAFTPDAVIFPWWVMYWAPQFMYMIRALRRRLDSVGILFICHNVTAHEPSAFSRFLTRRTLRLGDGFLVHSRQEKNELQELLPGARIVCADHPAYDVPQGEQLPRQSARARLGLTGNLLLFFGFVRPYKGLDVLLRAMALLPEQQNCTLVVAGEIWGSRERYDRLVEELKLGDRVHFTGNYVEQHRVPLYFRACDLVVLPYLSATGSGVVKLAYSYQRPVIVSRVGSLPESVVPGQTGDTVPAGDPGELAAAISDFLRRDDRELVEQAIARYVGRFSWDAVADGLQQLLQACDR